MKIVKSTKSLTILSLLLASTLALSYISLLQINENSKLFSSADDVVKNAPWAFQMQNQQNTGYSPQSIINSSNVGELSSLWNVSLTGLTGTPVVSNDIVYVTGSGSIYAVNETTGILMWTANKKTIGFAVYTRVGVTIDNGNIFTGSTTNQLLSINATTGALNWNVSIITGVVGDLTDYSGAEATPLVYKGLVMVGETVGDGQPGVRGFLRAFNESNGALVWTFYTVPPSPIRMSTNQTFYHNTWYTNGSIGCACGGGAVWNVPAVDPNTGIIYFGTGNPSPNPGNNTARSGPSPLPSSAYTNLYTDSVIALNSTTGKLIWYYQEVPDDQWDHDLGMPVQLFTTTIKDVPTRVVGSGGKPGYYFELNAATGALIYKTEVGIHLVDNPPWNTTGIVYQGGNGGINTFSTYDADTNMIYTIANNQATNCGGVNSCPTPNSTLYAIDASTGNIVWNMNMTTEGGGVSSTNSLVFTSNGNHTFYALNGFTGAILWEHYDPTGSSPYSWSWGPPSITDGKVFETTWATGTTKTTEPGQLEAYSLPLYSVKFKVGSDGGGNTSPTGGQEYVPGSVVQISANAYPGYKLKTWLVSSGSSISIANPTTPSTTATINSAGIITAKFVPTVALTLKPTSGTVASGKSLVISANISGGSQTVTLSTSKLANGITVSFSQNSVSDSPTGVQVSVTVSTSNGVKPRAYNIIIIARGANAQTSKQTFNLAVT